jgi:hypothetical protein
MLGSIKLKAEVQYLSDEMKFGNLGFELFFRRIFVKGRPDRFLVKSLRTRSPTAPAFFIESIFLLL